MISKLVHIIIDATFVLSIFLCPLAYSQKQSHFHNISEPPNLYMDQDYTTQTYNFIDDYGPTKIGRRGPDPIAPGIYYLRLSGAYMINLDSLERSEIINALHSTIDSSFYDNQMLRYPQGFYYELANGSVKRREYHLRYAEGDTVYVISGWLGKFLSFYRVIPDQDSAKYTIGELQDEVKKLAPSYIKGDSSSFLHWIEGDNYFLEYIDRKNQLRIRSYFMYQSTCYDEKIERYNRKIFNLIEITRFLDKDIMPPKDYVYDGEIPLKLSDINRECDTLYQIVAEPLNIDTPNELLGLGIRYQMEDGNVSQTRRDRNPKNPGDYFLLPRGAYGIKLDNAEFEAITTSLKSFIIPSLYNPFVLANLKGYYYEMNRGTVKRREYHVRYTRGDTVYVISGWLGNVISFYYAIPGDFKYSIDELQKDVKKLSPTYKIAPATSFKDDSKDGTYFLEYVDRKNMMRIRSYFVSDTFSFNERKQKFNSINYTLIEITKFLDKNNLPDDK